MRPLAAVVVLLSASAFAQGWCLDRSFSDGGVFLLDVGGVDNVGWSAQGLDLQTDGRLIVGGTIAGAPAGRFLAVRLSTNGTLDPTFDGTGVVDVAIGASNAELETIRVQPDGTIVLAGAAEDPLLDGGGRLLVVVARLTSAGALDSAFGGGVLLPRILPHPEIVNGQLPLSNGGVLLAGQGRTRGADYNLFTLALLRDGGLDTSYGDGGISEIDFSGGDEFGAAIAQDQAGRVLVPATTYRGTQFDFGLARLTPNGVLDPSFGIAPFVGRVTTDFFGGSDACTVALEQPNGRILCGGNITLSDGGAGVAVMRTLASGLPDLSFGPGGRTTREGANWSLRALAVLSDGTIVAGGAAPGAGRPDTDLTLGFLDSAGSFVPGIGAAGVLQLDVAGGNDGVRTLKVDQQGRLLVFGAAERAGQNDLFVARLSPCGDAGVPDAGTPDAGTPDAGTPDAGAPDAGTPDAGTPDAGTPDAGTPDAGTPDAGTPDAGTPDAGTPLELRVGCGCSAAPSWSLLAAWWLLAFRRARARSRSAA